MWVRASVKNLKSIYSEKATKFCKIFPLLLTACTLVKSKGKISQNFVAFSEYMNFTCTVLDITFTCASSSGFLDCLQTMTTLCQISFGLKRLMRRACLVRRASLRTLGNMFQTMALTRRSSSSQMNRKMSLKVESSEKCQMERCELSFHEFFADWFSRRCL